MKSNPAGPITQKRKLNERYDNADYTINFWKTRIMDSPVMMGTPTSAKQDLQCKVQLKGPASEWPSMRQTNSPHLCKKIALNYLINF